MGKGVEQCMKGLSPYVQMKTVEGTFNFTCLEGQRARPRKPAPWKQVRPHTLNTQELTKSLSRKQIDPLFLYKIRS